MTQFEERGLLEAPPLCATTSRAGGTLSGSSTGARRPLASCANIALAGREASEARDGQYPRRDAGHLGPGRQISRQALRVSGQRVADVQLTRLRASGIVVVPTDLGSVELEMRHDGVVSRSTDTRSAGCAHPNPRNTRKDQTKTMHTVNCVLMRYHTNSRLSFVKVCTMVLFCGYSCDMKRRVQARNGEPCVFSGQHVADV